MTSHTHDVINAKEYENDSVDGEDTKGKSSGSRYECIYDVIPWLSELPDSDDGDDDDTVLTDGKAGGRCRYLATSDVIKRNAETESTSKLKQFVTFESSIFAMGSSLNNGTKPRPSDLDLVAPPGVRQSYVKNTVLLGVGIALCLTPVYAQRSFLSSANRYNDIGRLSLLVFYTALSVGLVYSSRVSSSWLYVWRLKQTVTAAILGTIPFSVACSSPSLSSASAFMLLTAMVAGWSVACLMVMQGTYLSSVCWSYAAGTGTGSHREHSALFMAMASFMAVMHHLSLLLGNLVTSAVYQLTSESSNFHVNIMPTGLQPCNDVSDNMTSHRSHDVSLRMVSPSGQSSYVLVFIYSLLTSSGVLVIYFGFDQLDIIVRHPTRQQPIHFLKPFVRLTKCTDNTGQANVAALRLVAPLALFIGAQEAFIYCDFSALVDRLLGLPFVGYTLICYTAFDVTVSAALGAHFYHREMMSSNSTAVFLTACGYGSLVLAILLWKPPTIGSQPTVMVVLLFAVGFGTVNALWRIILYAAYNTTVLAGMPRQTVYFVTWFQQALGFCLQLSAGLLFPMSDITARTLVVPMIAVALAVIGHCWSRDCSCRRHVDIAV